MLGSLARKLRMAGIDTIFWRIPPTAEIVEAARREGRIILTRSVSFCGNPPAASVYRVQAQDTLSQYREVIRFFSIALSTDRVLTRCLACNGEIVKVGREEVRGKVPEYVFHTVQDFSMCPNCNKFFWKGTHFNNIMRFLQTAHKN